MSYFFPSKTNHRRVRSHIMRAAMKKLAAGSLSGRRATEGVTHILKGATYLPEFDKIDIGGAVSAGLVTPKQAMKLSGKARGLRKGALWATALNRAGIPVALDYFDPTTTALPPIIDALVNAAGAALAAQMTEADRATLCHEFHLPIEKVGPAGWTDAHDVLAAQGIVEENPAKIEFALAHANGEMPDTHIDLDYAAMMAAENGATPAIPATPAAPKMIAQDAPALDIEAMIAAAVKAQLSALKVQ